MQVTLRRSPGVGLANREQAEQRGNADQLLSRLKNSGYSNATIRTDTTQAIPIYRVRLGPIANVQQFDELVREMSELHIRDTHLVTESMPAAGG